MSTRALVLDFGGVISRTLFETHRDNERALGVAAGTLRWRGPFAPDSDPLWQRMQADEISERDYWHRRAQDVAALVGETGWSMANMVQRLRGDDPDSAIRPEAREAIARAAAAGYKLAVLSNELDLFYGSGFAARLPLLQDFDAIVDASYTGILKPDPAAYSACADQLGLELGRCVFVDDQARNIAGAEACGMPCVHFDVHQPADSFNAALTLLNSLQG
ncbi:MAG: HAD-IA family hydrolase [Pseudomonadota bacterium]